MKAKLPITAAAALAILAVPVVADGRLPEGGERVKLDPAHFTTKITNPYFPMRPGTRWTYRETDPEGTDQRTVVTVTRDIKRIANGVTARVVHDVVTEKGGRPVEVTDDFFAQDRRGNIWYLGEAVRNYEKGRLKDTEGSFEAGVHGAQAGVAMPAKPRRGMRYRQEFAKGTAEDKGRVFSLNQQVEVPFGHYRRGRVLMTEDLDPLEPRAVEYKYYVRGLGPVLTLTVSGGSEREELIGYKRGR
jgi:hypothetical protein